MDDTPVLLLDKLTIVDHQKGTRQVSRIFTEFGTNSAAQDPLNPLFVGGRRTRGMSMFPSIPRAKAPTARCNPRNPHAKCEGRQKWSFCLRN